MIEFLIAILIITVAFLTVRIERLQADTNFLLDELVNYIKGGDLDG